MTPGLFAGSGVGKSSLLGALAGHIDADVVVIAMIGERGREVRHFVEEMIGPEGMARTVVVAATSDQSPLKRRRCGWTAMAVAEHFRIFNFSRYIGPSGHDDQCEKADADIHDTDTIWSITGDHL